MRTFKWKYIIGPTSFIHLDHKESYSSFFVEEQIGWWVELLLLLLFTYKPQLSYVASVEGKIGRKGRRKNQSLSLSLKREKKPILECKFTKYCFLFNLHNHKTNPNFCKRNCHHEFLFVARNKLKIGNTTRTLCQQLYPRMISWLLFSKWYKELIPKPLAWFQH